MKWSKNKINKIYHIQLSKKMKYNELQTHFKNISGSGTIHSIRHDIYDFSISLLVDHDQTYLCKNKVKGSPNEPNL